MKTEIVNESSPGSGRKNKHIAVDLDGTLAWYDGFKGSTLIGPPVPLMVDRVKAWLNEGFRVTIFTSRLFDKTDKERSEIKDAIIRWCLEHIGCVLPVTCEKDKTVSEFWDDRAFRVQKNTGVCVEAAESVPARLLLEGAVLFEERNFLYKDNYHNFGKLLLLLFRNQTIPQIKSSGDAARLNVMINCLCKLQRYGYNFDTGGHEDSAKDLKVYAAMLEEITMEKKV